MKCDLCKIRDAQVHINTMSNGMKVELHLCRECVKNIEQGNEDNVYYSNFLKGIISKTSNISKQYECPSCHTTYETFKRTGEFGCVHCYETFERDVNEVLKQICGSTMHVGKYPAKKFGYLKTKEKVENIREKLKIAILEEEYELAAKLRDEIRSMEKELSDE